MTPYSSPAVFRVSILFEWLTPRPQWITHTPAEVLAKNFGVNASVFTTVPAPDPYILNGTVTTANDTGAASGLFGNSSYVFHDSAAANVPVPGGGGTLKIIDSRNFPIATTIAATVVNLEPNGLRYDFFSCMPKS